MRDVMKLSPLDTSIVPRGRNHTILSDSSDHKIECYKNALDNIRQICENDRVKPKMKVTLINTIAGMTMGLTDEF